MTFSWIALALALRVSGTTQFVAALWTITGALSTLFYLQFGLGVAAVFLLVAFGLGIVAIFSNTQMVSANDAEILAERFVRKEILDTVVVRTGRGVGAIVNPVGHEWHIQRHYETADGKRKGFTVAVDDWWGCCKWRS